MKHSELRNKSPSVGMPAQDVNEIISDVVRRCC